MFFHTSKLVYQKNKGFHDDLGWFDLFAYTVFLKWLFVLVFMLFISVLIKWMLVKKMNTFLMFVIHILLSISMFYFVFSLGSIYIYTFGHFDINAAFRNVSFGKFMSEVTELFLVYFSLIGIIYGYHYIQKVKKVQGQKTKIANELSISRVKMLNAKLHPQFIFSTLNSISTLMETDAEKTQNLIADFGDLFRFIIENQRKKFCSVHNEMIGFDKYAEIIAFKYNNELVVRKKVPKKFYNYVIPNQLLIPFFENVLSYVVKQQGVINVDFSIKLVKDKFNIQFVLKGEQLEDNMNTITQLENNFDAISERLVLIYENDYDFVINYKSNKEMMFKLEIPFQIK